MVVSKKSALGISKEAKIGIIGFIVLGAVLFTFNFLNRKNVFSTNLIITAEFKKLDYIKKGELVLIKGREAGRVVAIYKDGDRLLVDLDIEPTTRVPKTAKAVISELSMLGGRTISLVFDAPCTNNCLESGAVVPGSVYTLKEQVEAGAGPILKSFGKLADSLTGPNGMDQMLENAYASLHSLQKTTSKTNSQFRGLQRSLPGNVRNFRELTAALLGATPNGTELAESMASNREMALALDSLVHNLSNLDQAAMDSMTQILYTAYEAAGKVPEQLEGVKANIAKADTVLDGLELSLAPYQRGQKGMVPKLLYSQAFRDSTQQSIKDLSEQIKGIRETPEQYLSF